jgi:predicted transcriptional regulator
MKRSRSDVTDAELAVLKILWDRGASTIRQITDLLYPDGAASHYATVQKLLERLQAKGCVGRRPEGRGHIYRAAIERDDLIARRLRDTADRLCEGSLTPLLTHLAGATKLSREELAALREIVERRGLPRN